MDFEDRLWDILDAIHLGDFFDDHNIPPIVFPIFILAVILLVVLSMSGGPDDLVTSEQVTSQNTITSDLKVYIVGGANCKSFSVSLMDENDQLISKQETTGSRVTFEELHPGELFAQISSPDSNKAQVKSSLISIPSSTLVRVEVADDYCQNIQNKGSLKVSIVDENTNQPITATISLFDSGDTKRASRIIDGSYTFSELLTDWYYLTAKADGYQDYIGSDDMMYLKATIESSKTIQMKTTSSEITFGSTGSLDVCIVGSENPDTAIIEVSDVLEETIKTSSPQEGCVIFTLPAGHQYYLMLDKAPKGCAIIEKQGPYYILADQKISANLELDCGDIGTLRAAVYSSINGAILTDQATVELYYEDGTKIKTLDLSEEGEFTEVVPLLQGSRVYAHAKNVPEDYSETKSEIIEIESDILKTVAIILSQPSSFGSCVQPAKFTIGPEDNKETIYLLLDGTNDGKSQEFGYDANPLEDIELPGISISGPTYEAESDVVKLTSINGRLNATAFCKLECGQKGDLNNDGLIGSDDSDLLKNLLDAVEIAGSAPYSPWPPECADLNDDGLITTQDYECIIQNHITDCTTTCQQDMIEQGRCYNVEVCSDGYDNNCDGQTDTETYDNSAATHYGGLEIEDVCSCTQNTPCDMIKDLTGGVSTTYDNIARCAKTTYDKTADYTWHSKDELTCNSERSGEKLTCSSFTYTCDDSQGIWQWQDGASTYPPALEPNCEPVAEPEPVDYGDCSLNIDYTNICSCEKLQLIGNDPNYPLDGDYVLTNDIDCTKTQNWNYGAGFIPIGDRNNPFTGTFNGSFYEIKNLYIDQTLLYQQDSTYSSAGLFETIEFANISNLGIVDARIVLMGSGAILANSMTDSAVNNVYVTGHVRSLGEYVGGLSSRMTDSQVRNTYANVKIDGEETIGGLLAFMRIDDYEKNPALNNTYTITNIDFEVCSFSEGGIYASLDSSIIQNSYTSTMITWNGKEPYTPTYGQVSCVGAVTGTWTQKSSRGVETKGVFFNTEAGLEKACGQGGSQNEYCQVEALDKAQMSEEESFEGWDFENIWKIPSSNHMPCFKWQDDDTCALSGAPDCMNKQCGADGRGGTCGLCGRNQGCQNYQCINLTDENNCGQVGNKCSAGEACLMYDYEYHCSSLNNFGQVSVRAVYSDGKTTNERAIIYIDNSQVSENGTWQGYVTPGQHTIHFDGTDGSDWMTLDFPPSQDIGTHWFCDKADVILTNPTEPNCLEWKTELEANDILTSKPGQTGIEWLTYELDVYPDAKPPEDIVFNIEGGAEKGFNVPFDEGQSYYISDKTGAKTYGKLQLDNGDYISASQDGGSDLFVHRYEVGDNWYFIRVKGTNPTGVLQRLHDIRILTYPSYAPTLLEAHQGVVKCMGGSICWVPQTTYRYLQDIYGHAEFEEIKETCSGDSPQFINPESNRDMTYVCGDDSMGGFTGDDDVVSFCSGNKNTGKRFIGYCDGDWWVNPCKDIKECDGSGPDAGWYMVDLVDDSCYSNCPLEEPSTSFVLNVNSAPKKSTASHVVDLCGKRTEGDDPHRILAYCDGRWEINPCGVGEELWSSSCSGTGPNEGWYVLREDSGPGVCKTSCD